MRSIVEKLGTRFIIVQNLRIKTVNMLKFRYQNYIFLFFVNKLVIIGQVNGNYYHGPSVIHIAAIHTCVSLVLVLLVLNILLGRWQSQILDKLCLARWRIIKKKLPFSNKKTIKRRLMLEK